MSDDSAAILVYRLVDTSIRWGFLIAALAAWLAIRPPRRAATRHALCTAVLLAGPLLAVSPRWGDAAIPWPSPAAAAPAPAPPTIPLREPPPPIVMPREPIVESSAETEPVVAIEPSAPPPSEPIDWPKLAWRAVAGAWVAGTIMMLARLLLGAGSLARWSRRAVSPSADDLAMFDACRAALPTSRPVRLARHPDTTSPIVVGGLSPLILLPGAEAWDERPADQRRAALWHELAHVRRYDDAWKLLQELIRVPSWHHPLVHWLLGRLDRERELLCDEAAVSLGDDPKGLARLLLELCRRPASRPVPSTSLPFLDRRTTAIRIERLLEDDMTRSLSRPSLFRTLTIGPLALIAALGIGGLRVRLAEASEPPGQEPPPTAGGTVPKADVFTGEIIDSQGRPIAGATGVEIPVGPSSRRVVTDAEGRFTLEGTDLSKHTPFVFWAPGYIPMRGLVKFVSRPQVTTWRLPLQEASPFSGQIVDDRGEPIAGVTLRLKRIVASEKQGDNGFKASTFPIGADWPAPGLSTTTTADGSFTFPYASRTVSTDVDLEIRTGDGRLMVPRPEPNTPPFRIGFPFTIGSVAVSTAEKTRITVVPAARLEGSVASQVQGVDLSQLRVRPWPSIDRAPGPFPFDETYSVPVAADGRFTIDGLNTGRIDLRVEGPGREQDWIAADARDIQPILGATTSAVLTLRAGIEVVGKVVERGTGRPASGVTFGASDLNLMFGHHAARVTTDAQGRYRLRMEPGRRIFGVSVHGGWDQWQGMESKRFVTVPEGVARFEGPTIEMPPYVAARVRVVDADHQPLAGLKVTMCVGSYFPAPPPTPPLTGYGEIRFEVKAVSGAEAKSFSEAQRLKSAEFWTVSGETDADGRLAITEFSDLVPGDEPVKVWVDLPDGTKHESRFASATGGVEVVMPRREGGADEFRGMVVDPQGQPLAGAVGVETIPRPGGRLTVRTGADGRFALKGVDLKDRSYFLFWAPGCVPKYGGMSPVYRPGGREWLLKFPAAAPFSCRLVDERGEPIAGATVRLAQIALVRTDGESTGRSGPVTLDIDSLVPNTTTITAADGTFSFPHGCKDQGTEVRLEIRTADGRPMIPRPASDRRWLHNAWLERLVPVSTEAQTQITAVPAARIEGKVRSEVPNVDLSRLWIRVRLARARTDLVDNGRSWVVPVAADGQFALDHLDAEKVDLLVEGPGRDQDWIAGAAFDVLPALGATTERSITLYRGVELTGKVVERGTNRPMAGATIGAYIPEVQLLNLMARTRTDADGRYRLRIGTSLKYVLGVDSRDDSPVLHLESKRSVQVPEGVEWIEIPPIEAPVYINARFRVVDADHRPVVDAKISWSGNGPLMGLRHGTTDADGYLALHPLIAPRIKIPSDIPFVLQVSTSEGRDRKFEVQPTADGLVEVVLPPVKVVAIVGTVVESVHGRGLPGVVVTSLPGGAKAITDAQGRYRLSLAPGEVRIVVQSTPIGFAAVPGVGSETSIVVPNGVEEFEAPRLVVTQPTDDFKLIRRLR